MTNDTRKPREFWMVINREEPAAAFECLAYAAEPTHGAIKHLVTHVIEYSAYEALKAENGETRTSYIKGLLTEIEALRKERDEYRIALRVYEHLDKSNMGPAREVLAKYPKGSK